MLTIWTNKIKHSTVGSSFSVTFSVAPNELEYLNKLYDCFSSMNWSSFPIAADRKTEPQPENLFTDKDGDVWEWRGDAWYCISGQDEPQTDCPWK